MKYEIIDNYLKEHKFTGLDFITFNNLDDVFILKNGDTQVKSRIEDSDKVLVFAHYKYLASTGGSYDCYIFLFFQEVIGQGFKNVDSLIINGWELSCDNVWNYGTKTYYFILNNKGQDKTIKSAKITDCYQYPPRGTWGHPHISNELGVMLKYLIAQTCQNTEFINLYEENKAAKEKVGELEIQNKSLGYTINNLKSELEKISNMETLDSIMHYIKHSAVDSEKELSHNIKEMTMALSIESVKLQELFLWKDTEDVDGEEVSDKLAGVIKYAFLVADKYNLDVSQIIRKDEQV